jgi:hypothetical protein
MEPDSLHLLAARYLQQGRLGGGKVALSSSASSDHSDRDGGGTICSSPQRKSDTDCGNLSPNSAGMEARDGESNPDRQLGAD